MYGATDSCRCSHNIASEAFQHWCIDQRIEVKRIEAVTQAIKEQRAREDACDHRSWFGLVGKNECSSSPDLAAQPRWPDFPKIALSDNGLRAAGRRQRQSGVSGDHPVWPVLDRVAMLLLRTR